MSVTEVSFRVLRRPNVGFDFGSYADAISAAGRVYDVYIFLNSGVTGPFVPSYMPRDWHWTEALDRGVHRQAARTRAHGGHVALVSS
jgi:hypothetical protein